MFSIRVKVTAITIIAILISILSVVIACNVTIQKENDRNSAEMMNLVGQNTQQSVDKTLENIEQSVETAANLASDTLDTVVLLENGVAGDGAEKSRKTPAQADRLDEYMAEYCARLQEDFESIASYTQDVLTYYYCINPEVCETQHGFYYSMAGKTGFGERKPIDARKLDPKDTEHTAWYYTPIERGRPSWVGPYQVHSLNEMWICSYLVPIYKAGTLIGVMGMDIPLETLTDQVSTLRVYDTGFATLLDEEGRVLYHPKLKAGTIPEVSGRSDINDILQQESSGDNLIRYTSGGEKRQMYFSTLSNGMKLVIAAPEAEITKSWTRLTRIILIDAAVIILVFALLVMFAMGVLTQPLKRLTAASQRLADGDYEVELDYKGRDEVGTLTKAFSLMRDHLQEYIEDLNRRIHTDDLTGLPNMRYFFQLAEKQRKLIHADGKTPYVLYFDLVGMKDYNRQFGFDAGDQLIQEVAGILRRHFGEQSLSRFGRDHYAAITDEEHLQGDQLEEKLQEVFSEIQDANEGKTLPIHVGIYPDDMGEVKMNDACDRAKFACDQLSGSYISDYSMFDGTMLKQIRNKRYFTSHLEQALEEKWVKVYYQPIIRSSSGKVCDEEALSRWIDPKRGMMSPNDFIPILESARLIYKLDLYVLEEILKKIKEQMKEGLQVVPHSLNLSREDFDSCDIVEEVRRRVDKAGIPHDKLTIEITESMVGKEFDFMKKQIKRFQENGFKVWMDDFGSGYSSLDVLQDIHFDLIKFDMRFMHRFEEGEESGIIVTELIHMANALGVETLIEGVETQAQVDFIKKIGGAKMQGFYYSKPISLEEIKERYRNGTQIGYEEVNHGEAGHEEADYGEADHGEAGHEEAEER